MQKYLTYFTIVALSFFYAGAVAQKAVPELWGLRVHDEAHVLSRTTIDELENQLRLYEDSTSNQIAVLVIPSLDDESLEEYSMRVVEKWKLGTKEKDNGVLILVAVDDHKMRIEVGQGLEGVLTDGICSRIIRNKMAPDFRRGDYDAGIRDAVKGVIAAIGGEYANEESTDFTGDIGMTVAERLFAGVFIFFILGVFTLIALFSDGCMSWGFYLFLIPFYLAFSWIPLGLVGGITVFVCYLIGFPVLKMLINRSTKWSARKIKWQSRGGSSRSSGWGGGSSRGFSGGGGSFGGGGSSGSW